MKITLLTTIILLSIPQLTYCQKEDLLYVSIQGSWDLDKNPSRCQFGGNNVLLNTYFGNSWRTLNGSMIMTKFNEGLKIFSGLGEINFKVTEEGKIDSIEITKSLGYMCDTTVTNIIKSTEGKWRAAQVDSKTVSESVTLWYSMYIGPKRQNSLAECLVESKSLIDQNKLKKALELTDIALGYDRLNMEAIKLKAQILDMLGRGQDACDLINSNFKYNYKKLTEDKNRFCR